MKEIKITDAADQQFGAIFNNRRVTLRLRLNVLINRWSLDLSIDDKPVLYGRRVVTGVDLLGAFNFGVGILFATGSAAGSTPGRDELVRGLVKLYHTTEADIASVSA